MSLVVKPAQGVLSWVNRNIALANRELDRVVSQLLFTERTPELTPVICMDIGQ
jgi:hypothetical protein